MKAWPSRIIAAQARAVETPACVWAFWLIALVPLVWPQSLDVVQFISSGVLQLVALPVLAVAGAMQAQRSRKQAQTSRKTTNDRGFSTCPF